MLDRLLEFAALCRNNGVRLSTAELLDAVRAAELVGLAEPEALREALRATLAKRESEGPAFDELFDLYFHRPGAFLARAAREGEAPLVEALRKEGLTDDEIEHLIALISDEAARLQPVARMALGLRRARFEALLRLSGVRVDFARLQNPMQIGFFTQQVLDGLGVAGAQGELAALEQRLGRKLGAERAGQIMQHATANLGRLRADVRAYVGDEFRKRNVEFEQKFRQQILSEKPFGALSPEELHRLSREVERLGRRLKEMVSLRPRTERRGRLDPRRTQRAALATGGVPFRLKRRRRRIDKPRLVVLCDISDSVRHVSRFMLQFAFTLQELFSKVRSFVFVSDLAECTDLFREHDVQRAVDLAYGGAVINVYANSNFGRAFEQFFARHLEAVTGKTTVIVIGDGRNNYHPAEAWALGAIHERARRLLWLNPEPTLSWNFGDSAMREYEPHCDRVETVGNLAQLAKVVDSLVL